MAGLREYCLATQEGYYRNQEPDCCNSLSGLSSGPLHSFRIAGAGIGCDLKLQDFKLGLWLKLPLRTWHIASSGSGWLGVCWFFAQIRKAVGKLDAYLIFASRALAVE